MAFSETSFSPPLAQPLCTVSISSLEFVRCYNLSLSSSTLREDIATLPLRGFAHPSRVPAAAWCTKLKSKYQYVPHLLAEIHQRTQEKY